MRLASGADRSLVSDGEQVTDRLEVGSGSAQKGGDQPLGSMEAS
jgi:hypothetical protein